MNSFRAFVDTACTVAITGIAILVGSTYLVERLSESDSPHRVAERADR